MIKRASKMKTLNGAVVLASALVLLAAPLSSMAAGPFSLDGINDTPATDSYDVTFDAQWWNAHGSSTGYPMWQDGTGTNEDPTAVWYGTGTDSAEGGSTEYSWLYLEVPIAAKNMIWGDIFTSDDEDDYDLDPGEFLDFDKMTGSEKIVFDGAEVDFGARFKKDGTALTQTELDEAIADGKGPIRSNSWGILDVRDSVDYLVSSGTCGTGGNADATCEERTQTMSFELKLTALDTGGATFAQLMTAIQAGISFHLSPEGRVESDMSEVPVPAAFWLFGTALIGFIGFSRRTNLG